MGTDDVQARMKQALFEADTLRNQKKLNRNNTSTF
jgi:hypothetical protein